MSLLFYDDSPVFGGHEVMSLAGIESVVETHSGLVRFIASEANVKLCQRVTEIAKKHPQLSLERVSWNSSKFEALRNHLKPGRIRQLAARFRELSPSLVIAIQGNIEHSSLALHAARLAGIPSTSYIPVPHTNSEMGARLGRIRDLFCNGIVGLPDTFVTITEEMARLLKVRGANAPIHIVYNGVDTGRFCPGDSSAACRDVGLPLNKIRIGVIGRIEFRQKQQHLLVLAVAANPALKESCHLVFAGDGPDSGELREVIRRNGVSGTVLPWCDPALLYQALDAIVIPSRYEGLPLVMLEALASETAVLGSDKDGMRDILPLEWRFSPNDPSALSKTISRFIGNGKPAPEPSLVARVRNTMSLDSFKQSFSSTILKLAGTM